MAEAFLQVLDSFVDESDPDSRQQQIQNSDIGSSTDYMKPSCYIQEDVPLSYGLNTRCPGASPAGIAYLDKSLLLNEIEPKQAGISDEIPLKQVFTEIKHVSTKDSPVLNQKLINIGFCYLRSEPSMTQACFRKRLISGGWYTVDQLPSRTSIGRLYKLIKRKSVSTSTEYISHQNLGEKDILRSSTTTDRPDNQQVLPPDGRSTHRLRNRLTTSAANKQVLEQFFQQSRYPNPLQCEILAEKTGFTVNRIKIWFNNRRSKLRHEASVQMMRHSAQVQDKQQCYFDDTHYVKGPYQSYSTGCFDYQEYTNTSFYDNNFHQSSLAQNPLCPQNAAYFYTNVI